jgi:DNA-binding transcriptional ArsR family regulator
MKLFRQMLIRFLFFAVLGAWESSPPTPQHRLSKPVAQMGILPGGPKVKKILENFSCKVQKFAIIFNHMVKYSPRLLDRTFAALADPTRRRILENLARGGQCVTDIARPYRMSLPAVSKHVRVLERAGLVRRRRRGRVHHLDLEAAPMKQAADWIEEYRRFWEESLDRLEDYLKELQAKEKHEHKD